MNRDFLKEAMEIQVERNSQAREGNKKKVREQERKLAEVFKAAKEAGVDTGELNNQLITYTTKSF